MSGHSETNEGKFMDELRAFANAVPHLVAAEKQKDLEKLVFYYENPSAMKGDPLLSLPPSEARVMKTAQEWVAPSLASHPFFRRVAEISRQRWSEQVEEIICASNYFIQKDLGVSPELVPRSEVLAMVENAGCGQDLRARVIPLGVVHQRSAPVVERGPSRFAGVLQVFKNNW